MSFFKGGFLHLNRTLFVLKRKLRVMILNHIKHFVVLFDTNKLNISIHNESVTPNKENKAIDDEESPKYS